jgi:hypothetical protein
MFNYVGLFSAAIWPNKNATSPIYQDTEKKLAVQFAKKPALYWIAIGKTDFLYKANTEFRNLLDSNKYPYEYYESDITYITKSKTISDSKTDSGIYGGNAVTLIDRDALAGKMTGSYEMSNVMEYCCNPGDGENSDQIWWESFRKERAYYHIVEETLKIDISGEKVTGVTLRIQNDIGAMTLNGKSNSSGTTNISL